MLHPQELHVANTYPSGGVDLLDRRPDGQDVIQMYLNPKTGDPERDRLAAAPEQAKKQLEDQWKQRGEKVVAVPSGWLPEAEWKPPTGEFTESRQHSFRPLSERLRLLRGSTSIITSSSSLGTRP